MVPGGLPQGVLPRRQGTDTTAPFDEDAPNHCGQVQTDQPRLAPDQQAAQDYPEYKGQMHDHDCISGEANHKDVHS